MIFFRKRVIFFYAIFFAAHCTLYGMRPKDPSHDHLSDLISNKELVNSHERVNHDTGKCQRDSFYMATDGSGASLTVREQCNQNNGDYRCDAYEHRPQNEPSHQINHDISSSNTNTEPANFGDFTADSRKQDSLEQRNERESLQDADAHVSNTPQSLHFSSLAPFNEQRSYLAFNGTIPTQKYTLSIDGAEIIRKNISSNEAKMEQLALARADLEQRAKWYRPMFPSTRQALMKNIAFIKAVESGKITEMISQIQCSDVHTARNTFFELEHVWPFRHYSKTYLLGPESPAEKEFIQLFGVDIMKVAETTLATRLDYQASFGIVGQTQEFIKGCHLYMMTGNKQKIVLERLAKESSFSLLRGPIARDQPRFALHQTQFAVLDMFLNDNLTQVYSTIACDEQSVALRAYDCLNMQLGDCFKAENVTDPDAMRMHMIAHEGFDVLTIGKTLVEIRPDFVHANLDELTRMLSTIKNADISIAQDELSNLKEQFDAYCEQQHLNTKERVHEELLLCEGFNPPEFAQALFESRIDHPDNIGEKDKTCYEEVLRRDLIERKSNQIFITQSMIIEALAKSTNHKEVSEQLATTCDLVFYNAFQHGHQVDLGIHEQMHFSLGRLAQAPTPEVFTFHLATVGHVLNNVQEQTALKAGLSPSLFERSPKLLARFVKSYFERLNPITQVSDCLSAIANTRHYLSLIIKAAEFVTDITVGKLYMSNAAYSYQKSQSWNALVELSKKMEQLEAEQVIDLVASLAADMTYGFGISKTFSYLKEIDAVGKTTRQAARVANKFKQGLDGVLAERPILITAEGIAIQAPRGAEELVLLESNIQKAGGAVKEVVKDTKGLLQAESSLQRQVATAANMHEVFDKHPVGKLLKESSEKTKHAVKGAPVYRANKKIPELGIKKGDYFYLDKFHGDHIEVFNSTGTRAQTVLNLDGSENIKKLNAAIKEARDIEEWIK